MKAASSAKSSTITKMLYNRLSPLRFWASTIFFWVSITASSSWGLYESKQTFSPSSSTPSSSRMNYLTGIQAGSTLTLGLQT